MLVPPVPIALVELVLAMVIGSIFLCFFFNLLKIKSIEPWHFSFVSLKAQPGLILGVNFLPRLAGWPHVRCPVYVAAAAPPPLVSVAPLAPSGPVGVELSGIL